MSAPEAEFVMVVDALCLEHEFEDQREAVLCAEVFARMPIVESVERHRGHVLITFIPEAHEPLVRACVQGLLPGAV